MTWMDRRLLPALACSLLLHALPFVPGLLKAPKAVRKMPVLEARLRPPPVPEQPPLTLPEPPKPVKTPPEPKPEKLEKPARTPAKSDWTAEVRRQLKELDRRGLFYPEEAIARGLQGEALVLLMLDEGGNVAAARIEQSSGHPILDEAALRAARSLKSLPAEAPRETQLPVRFRLR